MVPGHYFFPGLEESWQHAHQCMRMNYVPEMAIPYALKVLENPMRDITARYSMLCQSLGIEGWSRLKVVELRALKRPLAQALAFACVLSIGDFGVVALFGNDDFRTLPF